MKRCSWVDENSPLYVRYHDQEWGAPVYDDKKLFEFLLLEGFQAGLSWLTVLKKREAFRLAFDDFNPQKIADYDEHKIESLLQNPDIIRSRLKIKASISNAKIFLALQQEYGSFSYYIWHFSDNKIIRSHQHPAPAKSPLSDTISQDLKKRGMKYVGSVIIYSYLQAIGIIDDHEPQCYRHHHN